MIVDLRHNSGGDFTYAFEALGRFTTEKRLVFSSRTKNGKGANAFTDWHEWFLMPHGAHFSKKIAVLTDRYTLSAGERAAMAFDVLPQATLLGDTTNGSQATMIGREMANGWHFTLPVQQTRRADGRTNEGIGIAPDIRLRNNPSVLRTGRDEVLERALAGF